MKIRNPKTGEVFENNSEATFGYCKSHNCAPCHLSTDWAEIYPAEAASVMGYEVIDDTPTDTPIALVDAPTKEDNMNKQVQHRLAEMLGLEEDEQWNVMGMPGPYRIHKGKRQYKGADSGDWYDCQNEDDLALIIAHPERIVRTPHLTEPEITIMQAVGAKWVSHGDDTRVVRVELWTERPQKNNIGVFVGTRSVARVNADLFPSVKSGDCIGLE